MRNKSIICALVALLASACSQSQPGVPGRAHPSSTGILPVRALGDPDPHLVQRDATPSAYCLTCHVGYDVNSHPTGISVAAAAGGTSLFFPSPSPAIVLYGGEFVECTACHDDGSAGFPRRTVLPLPNTLCYACHNMGPYDAVAPTVVISSPVESATAAGTLSVDATLSDDSGISAVVLLAGPVGSEPKRVASFGAGAGLRSFPLDTTLLADGPTSIVVRAIDSIGRYGIATVSVVLENGQPDTVSPSVAITNPVDGAAVRGTVPVVANVADDVGVARVELWVGASPTTADVLVGTVVPSGGSAAIPVDTALRPDGANSLVLKAFDAAGNVGSAAVSVQVDNTLPVVAISAPLDGAILKTTTTIAATASDANGVVAVDFYVDGLFLARSTTAPYVATWTPVRRSGLHTLEAVAIDLVGNAATSAPVAVQVR